MTIPDNVRFLASHEWIEAGKEIAALGISDHAQAELSDVVYVELPETGTTVAAGDAIAVVESVKAASDIYAPAGGEIVEVNSALEEEPGRVNSDPFGDGWICKIRLSDPGELENLLTGEQYGQELS